MRLRRQLDLLVYVAAFWAAFLLGAVQGQAQNFSHDDQIFTGNGSHPAAISQVDMFPIQGPTGSSGLQSCAAACNNTTLLGPIDTTGYGLASVQITNIGGGASLTAQIANDPVCATATNWITGPPAWTAGSGPQNNMTTVLNSLSAAQFPTGYHCWRLQFTAYTSGTISAEGYLQNGQKPLNLVGAGSVQAASVQAYPGNANGVATPVTGNATGTTGVTTATLAAAAGKTTYICGYQINSAATAAGVGQATIVNLITAGFTIEQAWGASPNIVITEQTFTPCIPANAQNTSITTNSAAAGTGGLTSVYAWGFQL